MKIVRLSILSTLISILSSYQVFATQLDFAEELAKTKVEQRLAYDGVKKALANLPGSAFAMAAEQAQLTIKDKNKTLQ